MGRRKIINKLKRESDTYKGSQDLGTEWRPWEYQWIHAEWEKWGMSNWQNQISFLVLPGVDFDLSQDSVAQWLLCFLQDIFVDHRKT